MSRVFEDISLDSPRDIAACRLVSHSFKGHSSPFLLPSVTFSRQLRPLAKLREVLCHPYFRQHVARLIYDSSEYVESTASEWDQYVDDCERALRDFEYTEMTEQQRCDNIARQDLNSFKHNFFLMFTPGEDSTSPLPHTLVDGSERAAEPHTPNNNAFRLGCYTTFGRYMQRLVDQQWIRKEKIDTAVLAAAFIRFPRLHSVVFTDYRGLARNGESYDSCCRRLFGRSLEPRHAGIGGQTTPSGDNIFALLQVIAQCPKAHMDSLAIGPHAFEYTGEDMSELIDPNHPENPQYLDISAFENVPLEPGDELIRVLGRLQHLRLALCYSGCRSDEQHMREQLRKFLGASTPRLQTLTLHMIYLFWGGIREVPKVDNDARFEVFRSVVSPMYMPHLRSLSLRRWIFSAEELKHFLLKHSSTLRDLHLLGCLCGDDEEELARWGGKNLNLSGVELSGFLSAVAVRSANLRDWRRADPAQWRLIVSALSEQKSRHLETLWLAGRSNVVSRQRKVEIVPGPEWWKQPAYI